MKLIERHSDTCMECGHKRVYWHYVRREITGTLWRWTCHVRETPRMAPAHYRHSPQSMVQFDYALKTVYGPYMAQLINGTKPLMQMFREMGGEQ